MKPIREPEVALHVAGKLNKSRSQEIVAAARTDDQVGAWLEKYTILWVRQQQENAGGQESSPLELSQEVDRDLAARMYRSAETEEEKLAVPSDSVVARTSHRVTHSVAFSMGAKTIKPPTLTHPQPELQQLDEELKSAHFLYRQTQPSLFLPATSVKRFGVARVIVMVEERVTFRGLIPFTKVGSAQQPLWEATCSFRTLGIPLQNSTPTIDVLFATEENVSDFTREELNSLREECDGNSGQLNSIHELLQYLERGANA